MHELWAGLNTDEREIDIKDTESPDSRNEDISIEGKEKTRGGMSKVQSEAISSPIVALMNLKSDDCISNINMAIIDDSLKTLPYSTQVAESIVEDTFVRLSHPDINYSVTWGTYLYVWEIDWYGGTRIYIKQSNGRLNYLNIWNNASSHEIVSAYNAGASWDESTLTWNNQPALGSFIKTINPIYLGWNKFDLGFNLTNGVVFKTAEVGGGGSTGGDFYSSNHSNTAKRPYWSNY